METKEIEIVVPARNNGRLKKLLPKLERYKTVVAEKRGKGLAILEAVKVAKGEFVVTMDSDFQHTEILPEVIKFAQKCSSDILIGRRVFENKRPLKRQLASTVFKVFVRLLFGKLPDTQSGFKVVRRAVFDNLGDFQNLGFLWDLEFVLKAKKRGYRIFEYPIPERYSEESKVHVLRDGVEMLLGLVRLRLAT